MIYTKEHISERPFGIVCYMLYFPREIVHLFSKNETPLPYWYYSSSTYYTSKKTQRMAYFDLSAKYPNHRFIAFANKGKHPVDMYGETMKLKKGYEL